MSERIVAGERQVQAINAVCDKRRYRMKYLFNMNENQIDKAIDNYVSKLREKFIF